MPTSTEYVTVARTTLYFTRSNGSLWWLVSEEKSLARRFFLLLQRWSSQGYILLKSVVTIATTYIGDRENSTGRQHFIERWCVNLVRCIPLAIGREATAENGAAECDHVMCVIPAICHSMGYCQRCNERMLVRHAAERYLLVACKYLYPIGAFSESVFVCGNGVGLTQFAQGLPH